LGPTLNLTEHKSATKHDINNRKKLVNQQGLPYMPPNLANFGPRTASWEWLARFCPPPPKFSHWETLPALPHGCYYNRPQANFGTCYVVARVYSLEQQNAGRAHAGLCLASSVLLMPCYLLR